MRRQGHTSGLRRPRRSAYRLRRLRMISRAMKWMIHESGIEINELKRKRKLAEMEEQQAWDREMETSNCTGNGDPILATYEPSQSPKLKEIFGMDGEAGGAVGAVVIDASDDESTDLDESEAITLE